MVTLNISIFARVLQIHRKHAWELSTDSVSFFVTFIPTFRDFFPIFNFPNFSLDYFFHFPPFFPEYFLIFSPAFFPTTYPYTIFTFILYSFFRIFPCPLYFDSFMKILLAFVLILFFHSEVPLSGDPFRYKGRLEMTTEYFPVHVLSHVFSSSGKKRLYKTWGPDWKLSDPGMDYSDIFMGLIIFKGIWLIYSAVEMLEVNLWNWFTNIVELWKRREKG